MSSLDRGLQRRFRLIAGSAPNSLERWLIRKRAAVGNDLPEISSKWLTNHDRFENLAEGNELGPEQMVEILNRADSDKLIQGYEFRRGQSQYADAVLAALQQGDILLLEAGTGTGKSIGYLLPTVALCREQEKRAVIVTRTKSLQEQLFRSDLRKLAGLIPPGFKVSLLKGLANYLCLLRYREFLNQGELPLEPSEVEQVMALLIWEEETKSGDLTEAGLFSNSAGSRLADAVTVEEASCLGPNCHYYRKCYGFRARRRASKANLVITNYALLFADLLADGTILGDFGYAVLDEAHRLEAEAVKAFSGRIPLMYLARTLQPDRPGGIVRLATALLAEREEAESAIATLSECSAPLSDDLNLLGQDLRVGLREQGSNADRVRFVVGDQVHSLLRNHWHNQAESYQVLRGAVSDLQEEISELGEASSSPAALDLRRRFAQVKGFVQLLEMIADADKSEVVLWGETPATGETYITAAPIDVGRLLAERLYPRYDALLLTSATLDSEDEFAWTRRRLGLTTDNDIAPERLKLPTPFPLKEQLRLAVAGYLPPPNSRQYPERLAGLIAKLRQSIRMSTLVLCTSYSMIAQLEQALEQGEKLPGDLLVQHPTSSPQLLLDQFRRSANAMLIGTESFWEGVDLPGEALRLLLLTRLPFPVPDDPLELAKSEQADQRGENPFVSVSLPAAVLKYKQAVGRVIRSLSDWGVVLVTDSRMANKGYGRRFYDAAPTDVETFIHESLLVKDLTGWLYERENQDP